MKTTIDIPEKELMDAIRFTNSKTKKEAVIAALEDFNRRQRMAELVKHLGTFDSLMTNDEIENLEKTRIDTHASS
jgi:Bacterial antitoxin of type II TA system, VapB